MIITNQVKDELRRIQGELKKVFPAELHEVRDLPGGGKKWVFLPWQVIRDRLDDVAPDWQSDHSEIQYLGNDAICRCGLTILGVRKEAIASVPISLTSSSGKEMTRGSAADRLAAEAIKNSAEAWGVGRYLDNQAFTIKYLWDNRISLSEQMQGEVRRLSEQYKIQIGARQERPKVKESPNLLEAISEPVTPTISEPQIKRLWAIARNELKLNDNKIKEVIEEFGYSSSKQIAVSKYEAVISRLRDESMVTF